MNEPIQELILKVFHSALVVMTAAMALGGQATFAQSGTPFRVGYISDITGPVQGTFKYTYEGFKLFVDDLNSNGGISGRKLDVLLRDVQSDTQKSVNAVHELKSEKVSAIAGLAVSSTHAATIAAAGNVGLPVVAGFPPNLPIVLEPAAPHVFGVGQVFNVTNTITGGIARNLSKNGKRIACVSFEAPASIISCETALASAKQAGFEETQIFVVPQNQRDYRAVAASIAKFKPDVITDCFGQSHFIGLIPALGAVGYNKIYLNLETGINDPVKRQALKAAPLIDFYTYSRYIAGRNISNEGAEAKKLQAAATKAGISEVVAAHSSGWVLGQVVAEAFRQCKGDCSPEDFTAALNRTNVDPGGLTGANVKFTDTDHYGATAYRVYHFNRGNGNFDPLGGWYQLPPGKQAAK